jgi:ABC-2 type transport system ATP-binding protein
LGQNGAGKSTTMRMLTGTLAPSAGRVSICGVDLLEEPLRAKARLGYLPEEPPLYRELTVTEYLAHCGRLKRLPKKRLGVAIDRACERCALEDSRKRLIGNLSKGLQQRVGIAQAIIADPLVVVLDEPTVGLDPMQIRTIRALITELGRDRGVILSSHILAEIQAVCTHVQMIADGRLVFAAPLNELAGPENQLVRVSLRRPPAVEDLCHIPGIQDVVALGDGRFRLRCGDDAPLETLAEICYREDWGLCELYREERNLEQLFVELTMGARGHPE